MAPLPKDDLEDIVSRTKDFWPKLKGQNIFITGGTGFFGHWLVESFIEANDTLALAAKAYILTRNINKILERSPHLAKRKEIIWIEGNVETFNFPQGCFPYVIHAATDTYDKDNIETPDSTINTIVLGTKRVLDFAKHAKTHTLLYVSSGAVYRKKTADCLRIDEDFLLIDENDITNTPYARGKVMAEKLCTQFSKENSLSIKIVRCFAFVGPYLPLDKHFAIGNFIRDAISGTDIVIEGDGTSERTYLYASDLTVYLWTVIDRGISLRPYNIGGKTVYSILSLAEFIKNNINNKIQVVITNKKNSKAYIDRYVPSVTRIENELKLKACVNFKDSISKTIQWYKIGI